MPHLRRSAIDVLKPSTASRPWLLHDGPSDLPYRPSSAGLSIRLDSIELVAHHARKIPFLILAKFEVVTVILRDAREYAFATPLFVDNGAAGN
jgi:hypothetical protein